MHTAYANQQYFALSIVKFFLFVSIFLFVNNKYIITH